jgi:hypothetical protein
MVLENFLFECRPRERIVLNPSLQTQIVTGSCAGRSRITFTLVHLTALGMSAASRVMTRPDQLRLGAVCHYA